MTPRRMRNHKTVTPRRMQHHNLREGLRYRAGAVCGAVFDARYLKCVLLSTQLSSTPCSVAHSTLAPAARMQHPHYSNRRDVLRCSGWVARKDSCTACERTAFNPCRRTHSAIDTRRRKEEPTSAWPNRVSARCTLCTPAPSIPPVSMRACRFDEE
jgi:hypothetical protein